MGALIWPLHSLTSICGKTDFSLAMFHDTNRMSQGWFKRYNSFRHCVASGINNSRVCVRMYWRTVFNLINCEYANIRKIWLVYWNWWHWSGSTPVERNKLIVWNIKYSKYGLLTSLTFSKCYCKGSQVSSQFSNQLLYFYLMVNDFRRITSTRIRTGWRSEIQCFVGKEIDKAESAEAAKHTYRTLTMQA